MKRSDSLWRFACGSFFFLVFKCVGACRSIDFFSIFLNFHWNLSLGEKIIIFIIIMANIVIVVVDCESDCETWACTSHNWTQTSLKLFRSDVIMITNREHSVSAQFISFTICGEQHFCPANFSKLHFCQHHGRWTVNHEIPSNHVITSWALIQHSQMIMFCKLISVLLSMN